VSHREQFADAVTKIDGMLAARNADGLGPGLSLALTTSRGLIATRVYGVANAVSGEPVSERTLFQIGSITKHFTATACLRLSQRGDLDLHAPVTDVLPEFAVASRFKTTVTPHHLLTHTAGLVMMMDSYPSSWAQLYALRDTELGFEPGTGFSYSNVGYNVLQCMIQTLTGLRFDDALRELVFAPLGMDDSYGEVMARLAPRMAKGHKYSEFDDRPVPRPKQQTVVNGYETSQGCASVVTTAADLATFLRMELNGGRADDGTTFLTPETFAAMTHPYAPMGGFFAGTTQGYGVFVEKSDATGGRRRIIGGGENLGFEAAMYGDLEKGVGAVLFCNSFDVPWRETRYILDALIAAADGDSLPPAPAFPSADETHVGDASGDYVGTYVSGARSFAIKTVKGRLQFRADGKTVTLMRIGGDQFLASLPGFDHAMLSFERNADSVVVEAHQLGETFRNERHDGASVPAYPSAWDAYVGHYRSFAILATNFRIFVRKGTLMGQFFGGYVDRPLCERGPGAFHIDGAPQETLSFDWFVGGKAVRCRSAGCDFYRVDEP
jgi:D-alanyl-D-alanine carboxypeptidase